MSRRRLNHLISRIHWIHGKNPQGTPLMILSLIFERAGGGGKHRPTELRVRPLDGRCAVNPQSADPAVR